MPYPDRQNTWPYDEPEAPNVGLGNMRNALIGMATVIGLLLYCFL
jgi:hypothetical protein